MVERSRDSCRREIVAYRVFARLHRRRLLAKPGVRSHFATRCRPPAFHAVGMNVRERTAASRLRHFMPFFGSFRGSAKPGIERSYDI